MFKNPIYLLWLVLAVGFAALLRARAASRRRRLTRILGEPATLTRLVPSETAGRRRLKSALLLSALALLFAALAGPQWGVELVPARSDSRQVFIAVDTSLSMTAEDVPPNRLEKAKRELSLLLASLQGNRVGVLAFAGEAGILCPLTTDIPAAKQILSGLSTASIPVPGTAIGTAMRLAVSSLQRYPGGKALVLLTDGEDHHTDPLGAAEEAAAAGVKIFAIGIGTPEGTPLPVKEENSGALTGYKKDLRGQTVISRLDEKTLIDMAARTGGGYWRSSPSEDEISEIMRQIMGLEKSQGVVGTSHQYRNRFLFPLGLAFLLLLAEMLIPLSDRPAGGPLSASNRSQISRVGAASLLILLVLLPVRAAAWGQESALRDGNRFYGQRRYQDALQKYREAQRPGDARPEFNSADALYRTEDYEAAVPRFRRLAQDAKAPPELRAAAFYNLGDALVRKQDYTAAVGAYRNAVLLAPGDQDARHNLAVALRMLRHPPPPRQQCNNPKNTPQQSKNDASRNKKAGQEKSSPQSQPSAPRPLNQMSKEDAQRIMRSVAEKEKTAKNPQQVMAPRKQQLPEEDW